jgi:hypothetical protein
MQGGEVHDQIAEEVQHAAGIFLAEAAKHTERTARVEREDRLQVRRLLLGDVELLGAETGDADHADIAVAPGLLRDPFDQVVAVPLAVAVAVGLADPARRADDMHVAARDEVLRVAGLQRASPERRPGRLRRQRGRHIRALQVLVVDSEGQQDRQLLRGIGPVDIDAEIDAVAHGHQDVLFRDHAGMARRPVIGDRHAVAGPRQAGLGVSGLTHGTQPLV